MVAKRKLKASAKPAKRSAKSRKTKPRPAGRRAQSKQAIREGIVKAALSLFQTKGFDATTTKAIARKAGIAEGTVFNYFKSKDDIALHFFEQEVDQAMAAVRGNPRLRKAPLEEKLFTLVHSQLEFLAPYERFIGTALIHALKPASPLGPFSHRAQELRHRYVGFVQELFDVCFEGAAIASITSAFYPGFAIEGGDFKASVFAKAVGPGEAVDS